MKGFVERYNEMVIDSIDEMFSYVSNYNKFQAAKDKGYFDQSTDTFIKFLKYEKQHADRDLIVHRLFNLAMSAYKDEVAAEILNAREEN